MTTDLFSNSTKSNSLLTKHPSSLISKPSLLFVFFSTDTWDFWKARTVTDAVVRSARTARQGLFTTFNSLLCLSFVLKHLMLTLPQRPQDGKLWMTQRLQT